MSIDGWGGEQGLIAHGSLDEAMPLRAWQNHMTKVLQRVPMLVGDPERPVRRIAWCTGAAQGYFEQALMLDVDVFISGEISEQTVHLARETGVAYIAAGHHATERYGVQALGRHLAEKFDLAHRYIDIDNPV